MFFIALIATAPAPAEDVPYLFSGITPDKQGNRHFFGASFSYGDRSSRPVAVDGVEVKFFSGFPLSDTISIKGFYGLETYDLTKDLSTGSAGGDVAVKILDEVRHGLSLYASAGYRREFQPSGTDVATGSVTFGKSVKGFNLLGVFYLEKPFSKERDSVDVITSAAASYSFTNWLRWGVEYVGEDLEDIWEAEEAEGGARHLAATVVNLSPDGWTTQFTMGWGIGLTAGSAASVGRFLMLINF